MKHHSISLNPATAAGSTISYAVAGFRRWRIAGAFLRVTAIPLSGAAQVISILVTQGAAVLLWQAGELIPENSLSGVTVAQAVFTPNSSSYSAPVQPAGVNGNEIPVHVGIPNAWHQIDGLIVLACTTGTISTATLFLESDE
jgi:hypothetical protein